MANKSLILSFTTAFLFFSNGLYCAAESPADRASYPIRVAVIKDASEFKLSIKGFYQIFALPVPEKIDEGGDLYEVSVKPAYSGISVGGEDTGRYGIRISTDDATDIILNGRRFRGEVDIIRTESLKLLAVNRLDIEDYVKGVLYHEVSHWWPMEALKTQAIATRTFAVYKSLEAKKKDYDLTSDVYSQVYGGKTSEKSRTNRAVRDTAGDVLVYKDSILPAYFHATCGGHTEDASNLWKTDMYPLKGRYCSYCARSPHFRWEETISLDDMEKKMGKAGYKLRKIKKIRLSSRNKSGRIGTVSIIDSLGTEKIPANKFRLSMDPGFIRSTNFDVSIRDGEARFMGRGWGHGVGMCQWGAYFMARRGLDSIEILRFYYPGTRTMDLEEIVKCD